jgi:putative transposase
MAPGPAPLPLALSPAQQTVLAALLRRASCPQALALRVRVILGAADGQRNEPLARQLGCTPKTVRKWRRRWHAAAARLAAAGDDRAATGTAIAAALADAPRAGAPATFTAEQIIHIINLACRPPDQLGRPVTAWTPRELADEAVKQGIVRTISARTVERFLNGGGSAAASQPLLAQRQGQAGRS